MPSLRLGGTGKRGTATRARLFAFGAVVTAMTLPAGSANGSLESWRWSGSTICVVNNTYSSLWPVATVVQRYDASADLHVVSGGDCSSYKQKVWVSRYTASDGRCGVTTVWKDEYGRLLYARIQLNRYYSSCLSSSTRRAHVMSHELGHAVGLAHTSRYDSVMNVSTWSYDNVPYPTSYDYSEIERRYPW